PAAAARSSSCRRTPRPRLPTSDRAAPTTTSRSERTDMAPKTQETRRKPRPGGPGQPGKRKSCYFCKDKVDQVDWKNVNQLRRYISEKGKIRSRRITGACRRHQVQVATAVKRAREMALLPYVAEGVEERSGGRRDRGDRGDRDRDR